MKRDRGPHPALAATLTLYGDVFRALSVFEAHIGGFLEGQAERNRNALRRSGLTFSARPLKVGPWSNSWARWCYAEYRVLKLGRLRGAANARLSFYVGWRRNPENDRRALPIAYVELNYSKVGKRSDWKALLGRVKPSMPADLDVENYLSYSALMLPSHDDESYRSSVDALAADFKLLIAHLARGIVRA